MSEENKQECSMKNETLQLICQIEQNYSVNFTAQAILFKKFYDRMKNDERLEKIKAFVSAQTKGNREKVINDVLTEEKSKEILYLGIPGSLGRRFKSVKNDVEELLKILNTGETPSKCLEEIQNVKIGFNATTTTIMYLFFPECYIPIAGPVTPLLRDLNVLQKDKIESWDDYFVVLETLKEIPKEANSKLFLSEENNNTFKPSMIIALSYASWLKENQIDNILSKYINSDKKAKNIILTGIPGTGKTYSIMEFLKKNENYEYEFVQFHPSYDYEDFIEGLKPIPSSNGQIEFKLVNGVFKNLCKKAFKNPKKTFVMVIDEINRANLSRVFGELLYCLEYRGEFVSTKMTTYIQGLETEKDKNSFSVSEDKNNIGKFAIPDNVIILGTMNEVDRSIDAFDLALRRRFIWEDVGFSETALRLYTPFFKNGFQVNIEDLIKKANMLNTKLEKEIGKNYTLGHTYYFKIIDYLDGDFDSALCDLWNYHIKSIVREYCKIKFSENELQGKLEEYQKIVVGDKNNCNG